MIGARGLVACRGRLLAATAATVVCSTGLVGVSSAAVLPAIGKPLPPVYTTTAGFLTGVAVTSPSNVWAVGGAGDGSVLIVHWNGQTWKQLRAPRLRAASAFLTSVAATSYRNAWAVGAAGTRTLILHWNGASWKPVPSPSPGRNAQLLSVSVTKQGAAWAVGVWYPGGQQAQLIERWTGRRWQRMPEPVPLAGQPAGQGFLTSVVARSPRNAWAAGQGAAGYGSEFVHWNGSRWREVRSPYIESGIISALTLGPHGSGMALASATNGPPSLLLLGSSGWRRTRIRNPGGLNAITMLADGTAWAVGGVERAHAEKCLILRWDGRSWTRVASPAIDVAGTSGGLGGVAAYSSGAAWAVGTTNGGYGFILEWNGGVWE
jgi:hypothetical protein